MMSDAGPHSQKRRRRMTKHPTTSKQDRITFDPRPGQREALIRVAPAKGPNAKPNMAEAIRVAVDEYIARHDRRGQSA